MRFRSVKALLLSGILLLTGVAAGAATKPAGSEVRYVLHQDAVQQYVPEFRGTIEEALQGPSVGYVVGGEATDTGYTLRIGVKGIKALGGQLALSFDNEKLQLQAEGDKAFQTAGITLGNDAENFVKHSSASQEDGVLLLSWYGEVNAAAETKTIATVNFTAAEGAEINESTFRLIPMENLGRSLSDTFGVEAVLAEKTSGGEPNFYYYMNTTPGFYECGVEFSYAGSDVRAAGGDVTFQCENTLGTSLSGLLEIDGKTYLTENGAVTVSLAPGEYRWRVRVNGYGAHMDTLTVTEEAQTIPLSFENNESLMEAAAEALEIGYQEGDSAESVTKTLGLPVQLDHEVSVTWQSSAPTVITEDGHVFRPVGDGLAVALTASISRGDAEPITKTFTVYVPEKTEEAPAVSETPEAPEDTEDTETAKPEETTKPAEQLAFDDLALYGWAEDAIYHLAEEGVIRGTSDTTYTPGSNIRRGDYVLILSRLLAFESDAAVEDFADVAKDSYYYDAIMAARALGIAQGDGEFFHPEAPITRQDMITLTMRAVEKTGYLPETTVEADLDKFLDNSDVAVYAQESMKAAVGQEFIIGDQNLLDPLGYTTRAQAAVFVERILNAHNG